MERSVGPLRLAAVIAVFATTIPLFAGGGGFGGGFGGGGYGGYGGGGYGFAGQGGFNSDALRQNLLANVQYQVGFTDDEWSVIEPKLWKVVTLQAESGTGALGQTVNRFRGRGGAAGGFDVNTLIAQAVNNGNPVPVLQLQQQLDDLLDDPTASDPQISAKLAEYRAARDRALADLQAAQTDLQGVLTLRQEGCLLELGYLE